MTKLTYNSKGKNKSAAKQVSPSAKPETEAPPDTGRSAKPASPAAGASALSCESVPVSVLTFDTFQQRAEGAGEKLKWKGEVGSPKPSHGEELKLGKR
jgi:hypothetical protein